MKKLSIKLLLALIFLAPSVKSSCSVDSQSRNKKIALFGVIGSSVALIGGILTYKHYNKAAQKKQAEQPNKAIVVPLSKKIKYQAINAWHKTKLPLAIIAGTVALGCALHKGAGILEQRSILPKGSREVLLHNYVGGTISALVSVAIMKYFLTSFQTNAVPKEESISLKTLEESGLVDQLPTKLETVIEILNNPQACISLKIQPKTAILLKGKPGTGKTLVSRLFAAKLNAPYFYVKISDISSKWFGEAEKSIGRIFDAAEKAGSTAINGFSVICIDEFDSLGRSVEASHHEVTGSITNTFKEYIGNKEKYPHVYVIACTNNPELIDKALTRPGRFDTPAEMPKPTVKFYTTLIHNKLKDIPYEHKNTPAAEKNISDIATIMHKQAFTPADANACIDNAKELALKKHIAEKLKSPILVTFKELTQAITDRVQERSKIDTNMSSEVQHSMFS